MRNINNGTTCAISSTGLYLPEKVLHNADLTQFPVAARKLIEEKTGIRQRRHAAEGQSTSDLACLAALDCLGKSGVAPQTVDAIILATSTADHQLPGSAPLVQAKAGLDNAFALDINAVCCGSIAALLLGQSLILSGQCSTVLAIAADTYSRFLNPDDMGSYPYFGDGAGAVLLQAAGMGGQAAPSRLLRGKMHADGNGHDIIRIPAGGSARPSHAVTERTDWFFRMKGREVMEFAVARGAESLLECLVLNGLSRADIGHVILHQANLHIIEAIADKTGLPRDLFYANVEKYGNLAGASVLVALSEAYADGTIQSGETVLLVAFGGGLSWGSMAITA